MCFSEKVSLQCVQCFRKIITLAELNNYNHKEILAYKGLKLE